MNDTTPAGIALSTATDVVSPELKAGTAAINGVADTFGGILGNWARSRVTDFESNFNTQYALPYGNIRDNPNINFYNAAEAMIEYEFAEAFPSFHDAETGITDIPDAFQNWEPGQSLPSEVESMDIPSGLSAEAFTYLAGMVDRSQSTGEDYALDQARADAMPSIISSHEAQGTSGGGNVGAVTGLAAVGGGVALGVAGGAAGATGAVATLGAPLAALALAFPLGTIAAVGIGVVAVGGAVYAGQTIGKNVGSLNGANEALNAEADHPDIAPHLRGLEDPTERHVFAKEWDILSQKVNSGNASAEEQSIYRELDNHFAIAIAADRVTAMQRASPENPQLEVEAFNFFVNSASVAFENLSSDYPQVTEQLAKELAAAGDSGVAQQKFLNALEITDNRVLDPAYADELGDDGEPIYNETLANQLYLVQLHGAHKMHNNDLMGLLGGNWLVKFNAVADGDLNMIGAAMMEEVGRLDDGTLGWKNTVSGFSEMIGSLFADFGNKIMELFVGGGSLETEQSLGNGETSPQVEGGSDGDGGDELISDELKNILQSSGVQVNTMDTDSNGSISFNEAASILAEQQEILESLNDNPEISPEELSAIQAATQSSRGRE